MPIYSFPPIETADEHGLLAIGGDFTPESLVLAYSQGIFPWPISEEYPLAWFSPDPRGVLFFEDLHIPRSLEKKLRQHKFSVSFNQDFEAIIKQCQQVERKDQDETWITDEIIAGYIELFNRGLAYSVEVRNEEGKIVGGVYGVAMGNYYSGESMFHLETDASKVALVSLIEMLKKKKVTWLDTQMVTSVVRTLGGKEIPRSKFIEMLKKDFYV